MRQFNGERAKRELIESIREDSENGIKTFPFPELMRKYNQRRQELGLRHITRGTDLKDLILKSFDGYLEERGKGTEARILAFKDELDILAKKAVKERNMGSEMKTIFEAAKLIREDIFHHKGFTFSGRFPLQCQESSVPSSLKVLASLITQGTSLSDQGKQEPQSSLTSAQILYFNTKKKSAATSSGVTRHSLEREPPLPIFIGMLLHKEFRCKKMIKNLYGLGLSVSYHRVKKLQGKMASSLCEIHAREKAVVPTCLKANTFLVAAVDNIDWNPTSNLSQDAFHGTSISFHQSPSIIGLGSLEQNSVKRNVCPICGSAWALVIHYGLLAFLCCLVWCNVCVDQCNAC